MVIQINFHKRVPVIKVKVMVWEDVMVEVMVDLLTPCQVKGPFQG